MAEPRDPSRDPLEDRVRSAFALELTRAAADVRDGALAEPEVLANESAPRPTRRPFRMATRLAVVLALAAVAGGLFAVSRGAINLGPAASPALTPAPSPAIPRYGDGIPSQWQGQPVLRWTDAAARAKTMADGTSFLVGVWIYTYPPGTVVNCPKGSEPDPSWPQSWIDLTHCPGYFIQPDEGGDSVNGSNVVTFHFMAGLDRLSPGPAILSVHVHDPRASLCGDQQAVCDAMIVVEDAVWTGDEVTAPKPLSLADVQAAVATVDQHPDRIVLPDGSLLSDDVLGLPGARDEYSFPNAGPNAMQVMGVSVMQSADEARKALPRSQPGAESVLRPSADWTLETFSGDGWSEDFSVRWLIVENVAVRVRLMPVPSDVDGTFVRQLEAALRARL
ncbi:MAG TPA: hypothetical protein VF349_00535 [Candidatus Limnocylindrales bacterium]